MANQKILEIIGSFSAEEKAEFSLFLKSPFFVLEDHADYLLRLFSCLVNASTQPPEKIPGKSEIHDHAFPGKAFSESRLERALAQLNQLIEQFLVTNHYQREENKQQRGLDFVTVLRKKRLVSLYEKNLHRIKKEAEINSLESIAHYFHAYQIALEELEWSSAFNKAKGDLGIPDLIQKLEIFYLGTRDNLVNNLFLQKKVSSLEIPDKPWLLSSSLADSGRYDARHPLLLIQKGIQDLFLLKDPDSEGFEMLMSLINEHETRLTEATIKELYTYLRNICTILHDSGDNTIIHVLHRIQQDNFKRGYFYYNGKITPHALLNITIMALKVKNIEWAKQVVELNRYKILSENDTAGLYDLNMALCLFAEEKYEESLQKLSFSPTYPVYLICARRLELKIYYELQSDLLPYKIDAFRKFMERTGPKTAPVLQRDLNINFVRILLQLSQSKPNDPLRAIRLIKRIEGKKRVAERLWLIEKAQKLGGKDCYNRFQTNK